MTTLADARAELAGLLVAAGIPGGKAGGAVEPPTFLLYGDGLDTSNPAHVTRGQIPARFRIVVLAGVFDDGDVPGDELAATLQLAIGALRAAGWQLVDVGRDTALRVGGGIYLGAELRAARMIEL